MTGDERRAAYAHAEFHFENAHHRQAHRHQRGLGVLRQRELVFGAFAHQLEQLLSQGVIDLLEDFPRRAERLCQVRPHADSLAALTGKEKG